MNKNVSLKLEEIKPSIVMVYAYDFNGKETYQGSGVVLKNKGVLVTNCHIFAESEAIKIKYKERLLSLNEKFKLNVENDIMIIQLDTDTFPQIPVGDSKCLKPGQKIYTVSSPQGRENLLSEGKVIGVEREINDKHISLGFKSNRLLRFTADVSVGSSGGAILNENLELTGIISRQTIGEKIVNYAIPINKVLEFIDHGTEADSQSTATIEANHLYFVGNNAFESKNFDVAVEYYSQCLNLFPNNYDVLVKRAFAHIKNNKYDEASKDCNMAIEIDSDKAEAYAAKAEICYYENNYTNCISFYTKALNIDPYYLEANFNLSFCYYKLSNYPKALQYMNSVLQIEPLMFEALHLTGNCMFELDKSTSAIEIYNKLSDICNPNAGLYVDTGNAFHKQGKISDSERFYDKALEIEPDYPSAYSMKALCYMNYGKKDESLSYINHNIRQDQGRYEYYYTKGVINAYFNDFNNALQDFQKCINLKPDYVDAYDFSGDCYFRLGNQKEALEYYDKALSLKSDNLKTLISRGTLYMQLKKPDKALGDFNIVTEMDKDNYQSWLKRGRVYLDIKNYDSAIKDYTISIQLKKKNSIALTERGMCYYFKHEYELSKRDLTEAVKYDKNIPAAYFFLGHCKDELELDKGAINDWEKAIKLNPDYEKELRPHIEEVRKRLLQRK